MRYKAFQDDQKLNCLIMGTAPLQRFMDAQQSDYAIALEEVRKGRKRTHWMWYIFPQLKGLGISTTCQYYGIKDLEEAKAYLDKPVLGYRIVHICQELIKLESTNATLIFGSPDDMKLRSSMTLFSAVQGADPVFLQVLRKYFGGEPDLKTLQMISGEAGHRT